jgi:hypothetical protein
MNTLKGIQILVHVPRVVESSGMKFSSLKADSGNRSNVEILTKPRNSKEKYWNLKKANGGGKMRKDRGIFERPKGSGIWWVRYADNFGRIHREKVGPKGLAKTVYQKRKTEIREGKFFPEKLTRKREMLFEDMVKLFLEDHSRPNKRTYQDDIYRVRRLIDAFKGKALSEISIQGYREIQGKTSP